MILRRLFLKSIDNECNEKSSRFGYRFSTKRLSLFELKKNKT